MRYRSTGKTVSEDRLKNLLATQPGTNYSPEVVNKDLDVYKRQLPLSYRSIDFFRLSLLLESCKSAQTCGSSGSVSYTHLRG